MDMDSSPLLHCSLSLWHQAPPEPRTRLANHPTLLYSWWCTIFSATIIITRLCGRKVRSNMLFREDWIMMLALLPLFARMAFIHVVLLHGTNNVQAEGLSEMQIEHRELGSRMVLAARVFYAMFIWISKFTISEFLKRITIRIWRRSYELTLQGIRLFLLLTFVAVVVSTLAECQPFDHYWQVVPDPGPLCRQGYAQLITMGTCDIITDILLVAFPIPIVLRSGQSWKRKAQLVSLFSLSILMIGLTASRMPEVVKHRGRQQYRTVWASCEILASTAVSNAVILGSFLRDKGTKKNKYRSHSITDSIEGAPVRRIPTIGSHGNDSDEDLFLFLGTRVPEHLREKTNISPRRAQAVPPATRHPSRQTHHHNPIRPPRHRPHEDTSSASSDSLRKPTHLQYHDDPDQILPNPKSNVSFLDVGGLLGNHQPHNLTHPPRSPTSRTTISRSPSPLSHLHRSETQTHDFATPSQSRRGSNALVLSDVGDLLARSPSHSSSGFKRYIGRRQSDSHVHPPTRHARGAPMGVLGPMLERRETGGSLKDVGGLLMGEDGAEREGASGVSSKDKWCGDGRSGGVELMDLGGLMAQVRVEEDDSAAGRRRAQSSTAAVDHPARGTTVPSREQEFDKMPDLFDPGGLLK